MPDITFQPTNITVAVPDGEWLLEAAKRAGIAVETPCGGHGTCGKCLVRVTAGWVEQPENASLTPGQREQGWVLICQARVGDGPVTVNTFYDKDAEQGKFSDAGSDFSAIAPALLPGPEDIAFLAKPITLTVKEPRAGDGLSDYDRLTGAIKNILPCRTVKMPLPVLASLPEALRASCNSTLFYHQDGEALHIAAIQKPDTPFYGLAVDIGTTTVAVALVDANGVVLGVKTGYNAQIACGLDVISRINYAKTPPRRWEMKQKVLDTINAITGALCLQYGVDTQQIMNVSVAANTTMTHMLLGLIPEYVRLSPYTPAVFGVPCYTAAEIGLNAAPGAPVYIAPAVGSYVGGDIVSGLLCTSLAVPDTEELSDKVFLFIDIGTNGEIVLGNGDFMMACACSAGPAFEGGGISCGMRASVGAVENVAIDSNDGKPRLTVIGDVAPTGICGSGMIALTAALFNKGLLDPSGRLSGDSPYIRDKRYVLASADESPGQKTISVSEADLQNLIRAKAAVFSACRTLLNNVGMEFGDLSQVYVAGGFGRYLNINHATTIGLMPKLDREKFYFLGNTALMGAYMALVSEKHRQRQSELASKITYIDLSDEPSYMDEYTAALFLPHTDERLFV